MSDDRIARLERFAIALEASGLGVWDWDVSADTLEFSEHWAEIVGYTLDELSPSGTQVWSDLTHPEDFKHSQKLLVACLRGDADEYRCEVRLRHKQGHWTWIHARGDVVARDEQGRALRMCGTTQDISQRKRAEEALKQREEDLRITLDSIGDAVIATDVKGCVTRINGVAESLTGWSSSEVRGRSLEEVFRIHNARTGEKAENPVAKVITTGGVIGLANHTVLTRRDGQTYQIADSAAPIRDADGNVTGVVLVFRDVTEDYRMHAAVEESERRFRKYFELGLVGMAITSPEKGWVEFNDTLCDMFGYSREEFANLTWSEITHPEDLAPDIAQFNRVMAGEIDGYSLEKRFIHSDGHVVDAVISANVLRKEDGEVDYFVALVHDISQRRSAERTIDSIYKGTARATGEEFFRELVRNLAELLDVRYAFVGQYSENHTVNTVAVCADGAIAENFHYDLEGTPCHDVRSEGTCSYPDNVQRDFPNDDLLVEMGVDSYMGTPLRDDTGRTIGLLVVMDGKPMDATPVMQNVLEVFAARACAELIRREAEVALRDSEERFKTIFQRAPDAVFLLKAGGKDAGRIVAANEAAERMHGYDAGELVGKPITDLDDPEAADAAPARLEELASGRTLTFEVNHLRKDGTLFPVEVNAGLVTLGGKPHVLAFDRDITDRNLARENETMLQQQLNQAQKMESIGRLAGGIAHDFNNMLEVILGHAELALDGKRPRDPEFGHLHEIRRAGERSVNLTRQLLAFARRETVSPTIIDLNDAISGTIKMLKRLIGENLTLKWLPGSDLRHVKIDPSQMDHILANLCVNARDAMSDGGEMLIETANVSVDEAYAASRPEAEPGEYVCLTVSDDGVGMDTETVSRAFEPFFTTKGPGKGTGLGLATVYGIVKQNGGFAYVYSEPGQGTTIRIYLPQHDGVQAAKEQERVPTTLTHGNETILLVEDEPAILNLAQIMLERLGYTVLIAACPSEAIKIAESYDGEIQGLVTDVVMPEMNGRELARRLSEGHPDLKWLFMSGYTGDHIAEHGMLDESVHFIQKPFSMKDLAHKVRESLDESK